MKKLSALLLLALGATSYAQAGVKVLTDFDGVFTKDVKLTYDTDSATGLEKTFSPSPDDKSTVLPDNYTETVIPDVKVGSIMTLTGIVDYTDLFTTLTIYQPEEVASQLGLSSCSGGDKFEDIGNKQYKYTCEKKYTGGDLELVFAGWTTRIDINVNPSTDGTVICRAGENETLIVENGKRTADYLTCEAIPKAGKKVKSFTVSEKNVPFTVGSLNSKNEVVPLETNADDVVTKLKFMAAGIRVINVAAKFETDALAGNYINFDVNTAFDPRFIKATIAYSGAAKATLAANASRKFTDVNPAQPVTLTVDLLGGVVAMSKDKKDALFTDLGSKCEALSGTKNVSGNTFTCKIAKLAADKTYRIASDTASQLKITAPGSADGSIDCQLKDAPNTPVQSDDYFVGALTCKATPAAGKEVSALNMTGVAGDGEKDATDGSVSKTLDSTNEAVINVSATFANKATTPTNPTNPATPAATATSVPSLNVLGLLAMMLTLAGFAARRMKK